MKRAKLAVVTGATSGIGTAVARALAAAGTQVVLVGRSPRKLTDAAGKISAGRLAGTLIADLASEQGVAALLESCTHRWRRLDLLVHCAGQYDWTALGRSDSRTFNRLFEVNVRAPYLLTQGLAALLGRARGQVIFLNSSVIKNTGRGVAVYKASQHAVQGLADSLRQDLNRRGIRVSSLFLGRTATPLMRRIYAHEQQPYRSTKLLRAADVAQLIVVLSELSAKMELTDVHLRSPKAY